MFPIKDVPLIDIIFPTSVKNFIPSYEEIPKEFKNRYNETKWNKLFSDMFYCGLEKLKLIPKDGIDAQKALAHIRYVMGSWEPKHEHKEAACAFLFNEWFKDAKWKAKKMKTI